jgi:hypothetical protein
MSKTLCLSCTEGPAGEAGHAGLEFYIEGPFPGHHIFKCATCDERWIRHYGSPTGRRAWTRYSQLFVMRKPQVDMPRRKVAN